MKPNTVQKAIKLIAMLHLSQEIIDDLEKDGAVFRHKVKLTGKQFSEELQKFIKDFYRNMDESAQLEYHKNVNILEELLKSYFEGKVEVIEDRKEVAA